VPQAAGHLVILSGGLDSTGCMGVAVRDAGRGVPRRSTLTFDYGQRHRIELERAAAGAARYGSEHSSSTWTRAGGRLGLDRPRRGRARRPRARTSRRAAIR